MKHFTRISAVAAGSALALGLLAGPALADGTAPAATSSPTASTTTGNGLAAVKTLAGTRINGRLAELHALQLAVSAAANLTSSDKSTLNSLLSSDLTGLTALGDKISSDSTVQSVRADEVTMVDTYRVYLLVAPKTHLSIVFDDEAAVITKLQTVYSTLSAALTKAGGGTSAEQAQLADMQTQITAAQTGLNGRESTLLAIQPGPDATTITGQVKTLRTSAQGVRKDLGAAVADAKALRADLK